VKISDTCIRRPVFATVMSLVLVLLGIVSYDRLTVREYPNIDPPVVNVQTTYTGASAEIIETQVTQVLEDSLAGIEGIDFIASISRQEQSQITVTFDLNRDPDGAAADVRDRVSRVRGRLPDEIEEPIIQKVEADAQPIVYLAFSSDRHSSLDITDYADRYVKDRLQTLTGVAEVRIFGERRYSMRIWLDPEKMAAYEVTVQDVEDALRRQNVEVPSGRIESVKREFSVLSQTDLQTPQQFNDLIVSQSKGYFVRLADVGVAEIGPRDERRVARYKGGAAIALGVVKQATANPLDVSQAVRDALPRIVDSLPEGMQVEVAHDKSVFIDESIKNVWTTIVEAIVLVTLIIFLFLRSLRTTLIPFITIPVALIGAFALMFMLDFTINTLTLLALVMAIGLVVDDAIVMLENIFRHVEEGESPMQAAFRGSREIAFAVIAMSLTLAAVYVPIGFMTGSTGKLFTEFAWVLAGAVLVSGFVALTLSPMLCSRWMRHQSEHGVVYQAIERGLIALTAGYKRLLHVALAARSMVIVIGLGVAATSFVMYQALNEELAPYEDQGTIVVPFISPEGSTIDYTTEYALQIEDIVSRIPEVPRYFVVAGFPTVSQGIAFVKLVPWKDRERTQQQVAAQISPQLFGVPGILAFAVNPPPLGQSVRSKPVEVVLQTSLPYSELQDMSERLIEKAAENPNLQNLESDLKLNKPQLKVNVDRDKVADLGVGVETLGRTLESMLGGRQVTRFKRQGEQYDVVVQVADIDRTNSEDLRRMYVRGSSGEMVQLSNLVTVEETVAPKELNHFNQLRSATISASLAPGYTLGQALEYMEDLARQELSGAAQIDYAGQSREFRKSSAGIYVTFLLALAFIYLVLAAQFESWRNPLIIMLTVPLSIPGALTALYLSGGTLNIYSQVGLVTLIGLITKHGILIVEFANQLRARGMDMFAAVERAAVLRLRPILMTTGAMVLGAVPLAIATGAGAESRQDIGWVIVGGLLVGTFFTLFVIPSVYTLLAPRHVSAEMDTLREGTDEAAGVPGVTTEPQATP
jgi:multidrug efflux pump